MKLLFVETLPRRGTKHKLQDLIKEFVGSERKIAKVDLTEHDYKSILVAYSCIGNAIRRSGENVRIVKRENEIFLVRK